MAGKAAEDAAITEIAEGDSPVSVQLYTAYSSNLRKAVGAVFGNADNGLADRFRANVNRFAAYKAWHATAQVREALDESGGDTGVARGILHRFNRWQAAEYNTAVARSRTAKQWQQWDNDDDRRLFPNIVWLPSRSATPREEHMAFWNRVWPKDDPFWNSNQPGNLWNCKCDWEQTDEPATDGNPTATIRHNGLEGNPAVTGEIFTDNCNYVKKANGHSEVHAFYRDLMVEGAKTIEKKIDTPIDGRQQEVIVNKIGITESVQKDFGSADYWLRNELLEHIEVWLPKASYIAPEPIDLTHNSGKTLKLKKKMERAHKLRFDLGDKVFSITIFEYKGTGKLLFYCIELL